MYKMLLKLSYIIPAITSFIVIYIGFMVIKTQKEDA